MGGIFKAYDIRGSYPDELDEEMAKKIGVALKKPSSLLSRLGTKMREKII